MNVGLEKLPNHSRIWIYQAPRPLTVEEREVIAAELENFVADWKAHGKELFAGYALLHRRFIVLAVDESVQPATGCSIDDSVAVIRKIQDQINLDLMDRMQIAYRSENDLVVSADMASFKSMAMEGEIDENTMVFNNLVSNLGEFRTEWEVPAKDSWHNKYFAKVNS